MKKRIIIIGSILVIFVAYFFASPFIAVYSLRNGIENSDSEKISQHVDFSALRQCLKEQVKTYQAEKVEIADDNEHPLASLVTSLSSKFTDVLVDSIITPKGIGRILKGRSKLKKDFASYNEETDEQTEKSSSSRSGEKNFFCKAQFGFLSLSRFFVKIPSKDMDKGDYEFIFTRTGLSWKLSEAIIPFDKIMQELSKGIGEDY
jgi:hypothetical protein